MGEAAAAGLDDGGTGAPGSAKAGPVGARGACRGRGSGGCCSAVPLLAVGPKLRPEETPQAAPGALLSAAVAVGLRPGAGRAHALLLARGLGMAAGQVLARSRPKPSAGAAATPAAAAAAAAAAATPAAPAKAEAPSPPAVHSSPAGPRTHPDAVRRRLGRRRSGCWLCGWLCCSCCAPGVSCSSAGGSGSGHDRLRSMASCARRLRLVRLEPCTGGWSAGRSGGAGCSGQPNGQTVTSNTGYVAQGRGKQPGRACKQCAGISRSMHLPRSRCKTGALLLGWSAPVSAP